MSTPSVAAEPSSEIGTANRQFMEAFGRGDAASVAQLYTSGAQLLPVIVDGLQVPAKPLSDVFGNTGARLF